MNTNQLPAARVHGSVENLHRFLLAAAETAPDRVAVVELGTDGAFTDVSYRELARRTDAYTEALAGLGLDVGDRVLIESDTSSWAIAMLLACARLGLPFVPVSHETPEQRLRTIVEAAEPALLVQAAGNAPRELPGSVGTGWFGPDGLSVERRPAARARHRHEVTETDPAYLVFTSGTTGRPKGVVMSHRAVVTFFRGILQYGVIGAEDRVATTSSLQFDFALFDIGFTLGAGATLVVVDRDRLRWPRRFVNLLRDTGVTHVDGVPSIWRPILQNEPGALAGLDRLRGILFTGEDFPLPELRRLQELLPHVRFVNGYGATESMACSAGLLGNPLPEGLERLPIGTGHPGAELLLFDPEGRPVESTGVVGEIHLRSPALFTGYWDDPEATHKVLVPDPLNPRSGQLVFRTGDLAYRGEDGQLYFCGRADSQVQIRGHRVELGEVERRLREFPGVSSAVALVAPRPGADPALHAFVVADDFDAIGIRKFCLESLPHYMAPQLVHAVDDIPVTVNGKVDRAALLAVAAASEQANRGI
ncbi:adenylate forming domain class I superfamily protein [Kitasatospora sp. Ki12]